MTSFNFGDNDKQPKLFEPPEPEPEPERPVDDSIPVIKPPDDQPQPKLMETGEGWDNLWKDMPEYKSEDLMPFKTIYVHFETREHMEAFAKLLNQKITLETQSVWYPELEINDLINKKYIDTI